MTCPDCGEKLTAEADPAHYLRTGRERYLIVCPVGCGYERMATSSDQDQQIITDAAERYSVR